VRRARRVGALAVVGERGERGGGPQIAAPRPAAHPSSSLRYAELHAEVAAANALDASRAAGKATRQGSTRAKSGAGGAVRAEALLDPRKNRRPSRRSGKRELADLLEEEGI